MTAKLSASRSYQTLLEYSVLPVAVVSASRRPRFVSASKGFIDRIGLARAAVVGRALDEVLPPESASALGAAIRICLTTSAPVQGSVEMVVRGRPQTLEVAVHLAHGFTRHALVVLQDGGVAVLGEDGPEAVEAARLSAHDVEENARVSVSRELHDSTSQYLVAADLGVAAVLRHGNLSPEDRDHLLDVHDQLVSAKGEIRSFAHVLQPADLRELGLRQSLEKFCAGFARRSGLRISFTARGPLEGVPPDVAHAVFRVGQESLMNAYRHASATAVEVALTVEDDVLMLEVRDDGIGLATGRSSQQQGIGLTNIRSRIYEMGGEVNLEPLSPGVAVTAQVPLFGRH